MFTHIAISTLQNDRLNRRKGMLLCVFSCLRPIFAPLHPQKSRLQPFSLLGTYVRTLYIGKSLKRFYLPFIGFFSLTR